MNNNGFAQRLGNRRTYNGMTGSSSKTRSPATLMHSPYLARSPHRIPVPKLERLEAEGPPAPPPCEMTNEEEKIALSSPNEALVLEHAFGYNRAPNNIHVADNEIITSTASLAVIADINTGTQRFFGEKCQHNGAEVTAVAFCKTKRLCATGQRAKTSSTHQPCICVWKMDDASLVHRLVGHRRTVSTLSFCEDGSLLVSQTDCEPASESLVWDIGDKEAHSVAPHSMVLSLNEPAVGALFAPTGTTCAFYGKREVVFGDISLPVPRAHTKADFKRYSMGTKEHITAQAWGATKHVFLLGTNVGKVYSFPQNKITEKPKVVGKGEPISFIVHLNKRGYMICTSEGSLISYDNEWNMLRRTPVVYPCAPQAPLKMVAACYSETDAGGILIVGTADNEICKLGPNIFQIVKSRERKVDVEILHKGPPTEMRALTAHPIDAGGIACGGPRGEITFYDTNRHQWLPTPAYVCSDTVCVMHWDPTGTLLAVGLENGGVEVLLTPPACCSTDSSPRAETGVLAEGMASRTSQEATPSGKTSEENIFLKREPPRFLKCFRCCSAQITDIQFQPSDGNTLVASSLDHTVVIFSVDRKQKNGSGDDITQLYVMKDHVSPVVHVQYSLCGEYVLALMKNSQMKCWDVSTGKQRVLSEAVASWYGENHQYRLPQGWPCAGISSELPTRVTCSSNFGATVLATGEESAEIKLYRFPTKSINGRTSNHHIYTGHNSKVHHLCWTIDGRLLTMGSGKNDCILQWRLGTIASSSKRYAVPHNMNPTHNSLGCRLEGTPNNLRHHGGNMLDMSLPLSVFERMVEMETSKQTALSNTDSTATNGEKSEYAKTPTMSAKQLVSLRHQKLLISSLAQPKRTLSQTRKQKENEPKAELKTSVLSGRSTTWKSRQQQHHSIDNVPIASSGVDEQSTVGAPVEGITSRGTTSCGMPLIASLSGSKTNSISFHHSTSTPVESEVGDCPPLSDRSTPSAIVRYGEQRDLSPPGKGINEMVCRTSPRDQTPSPRDQQHVLEVDNLDTEWERRKEQLAEEARHEAEKELAKERKKLEEAKGVFDEEQRAWRVSFEEKEATVARLQENLRAALAETGQKLSVQGKNGDTADAPSTTLTQSQSSQSQSQSHLPQQASATPTDSATPPSASAAVQRHHPVLNDVEVPGWKRSTEPQPRIVNCAPSPEQRPGLRNFCSPLASFPNGLREAGAGAASPTVRQHPGEEDITSPRLDYPVSRQYSTVSRQHSISSSNIHRSLSPIVRKSSQGSFTCVSPPYPFLDCSPTHTHTHVVMPLSSRLPDSSSRVEAMLMSPSASLVGKEAERGGFSVSHGPPVCAFSVSHGPTGSTTVIDSRAYGFDDGDRSGGGRGRGGGTGSPNSGPFSSVQVPDPNSPTRMLTSSNGSARLYSSRSLGKEKMDCKVIGGTAAAASHGHGHGHQGGSPDGSPHTTHGFSNARENNYCWWLHASPSASSRVLPLRTKEQQTTTQPFKWKWSGDNRAEQAGGDTPHGPPTTEHDGPHERIDNEEGGYSSSHHAQCPPAGRAPGSSRERGFLSPTTHTPGGVWNNRMERFTPASSRSALWGSPRDFRTSTNFKLNKLQLTSRVPHEQPLLNWCSTTPPQESPSTICPPLQPRGLLFSLPSPLLNVDRDIRASNNMGNESHDHESQARERQPGEQPPLEQQQQQQQQLQQVEQQQQQQASKQVEQDHQPDPLEHGVRTTGVNKLFNMQCPKRWMIKVNGVSARPQGNGAQEKMSVGPPSNISSGHRSASRAYMHTTNLHYPVFRQGNGEHSSRTVPSSIPSSFSLAQSSTAAAAVAVNANQTVGEPNLQTRVHANTSTTTTSTLSAPCPPFACGSSSHAHNNGAPGAPTTTVDDDKNITEKIVVCGTHKSKKSRPMTYAIDTPPRMLSPSPSLIRLQPLSPVPPGLRSPPSVPRPRLQSPSPPTMIRQNSVWSMASWTMSPPSYRNETTDVGGVPGGGASQIASATGIALLALHKPQSMPRLTPDMTFSILSPKNNDLLITATLESIVDTTKTKADAIELPQGWGMFRTKGGIIIWMKITSEKSRAYDMFKETLPTELIFSAALLKNGAHQQSDVINLIVYEVSEEATNVQAIKECADEGVFNLSLGGYVRVRNEDQVMDQAVKNWTS